MKTRLVVGKQSDLGLLVDAESVNFVGVHAVVRALQTRKTGRYVDGDYTAIPFAVWGVINKKYEAVSLGCPYLEFNPNTQKIIQVSENDFLIQVLYENGEESWTEYKHVRICDDKAVVMYEFPCYMNIKPTPMQNVWLAGNLIYNVTDAKFVDNELVRLLKVRGNAKTFTK